MRVAIIGYGMQFAPDTLTRSGLGGSETAQLCMGKELAKLGVEVLQYCNFDGFNEGLRSDGVYYYHIDKLPNMPEVDVAIICRQPGYIGHIHGKFGKAVLWIQDFATADHPPVVPTKDMGFHEIWAVSKWQARQYERELLYRGPGGLPPFWVTRNAITRVEFQRFGRIENQLMFAARPERGLWPLVRPGGIMERLPEFELIVAGYDDRPAQYADFYAAIDQAVSERPNVKYFGSLPAQQLRQFIAHSQAYVFPTNYRETSCIMARECIEQSTPVIGTEMSMSGALPETLGECQVIGSFNTWNSDEFVRDFAETVRQVVANKTFVNVIRSKMMQRTDLYWDGVAREWYARMLEISVLQGAQ